MSESIKRWTVALLVLAVLCDNKKKKHSNQVNVFYVFVIVRFLLNGQISTRKSSIVRARVSTISQST